jgi:hypothetical protein
MGFMASPYTLLDCCAGRFADLIEAEPSARRMTALRATEAIGRPLGSDSFFDEVAVWTGRDARPVKREWKKKGIE